MIIGLFSLGVCIARKESDLYIRKLGGCDQRETKLCAMNHITPQYFFLLSRCFSSAHSFASARYEAVYSIYIANFFRSTNEPRAGIHFGAVARIYI